jgi:hypothetical protein
MASAQREVVYKGFSLLFFVTYCLLESTCAQATTFQTLSLSLERLTREADVIVRGHVIEIKSKEAVDRQSIATTIKLSVDEQWKGPKASFVTLRQPGGSVGGIAQAVTGLPQFSVEEEVILFLKKVEGGHFVTVGGKQGKFIVKTDPQSKKEFIEDVTGKSQSASDFLIQLRATLK